MSDTDTGERTAIENEIIALAWDDETSFDMIEKQTGFPEKDVIKLMRRCMKTRSFKLWRARVSGRKTKHSSKLRVEKI